MLVKVRVQVWQRNSSLSALSGPAGLLSGTPATQVNTGKVNRDLEVTLERWYQHKNSDEVSGHLDGNLRAGTKREVNNY